MPKAQSKSKTPAKVNPFKVRKTRIDESRTVESDTISPPEEIANAIDAFRAAQEQAKHFEGEAMVQKNDVLDYAQKEYAKRALGGKKKSFKLLGNESMVTYIMSSASAGLTDDEVSEIGERWGKKAADELVVRDHGSIKFNADVLEANYEIVVEALQTLPSDVLENLFRPMLMKAASEALETARTIAKSPEDLRELLRQLKITNYIK